MAKSNVEDLLASLKVGNVVVMGELLPALFPEELINFQLIEIVPVKVKNKLSTRYLFAADFMGVPLKRISAYLQEDGRVTWSGQPKEGEDLGVQ